MSLFIATSNYIDTRSIYIRMITTAPVSITFLISCSQQPPFTFTQPRMIVHNTMANIETPGISDSMNPAINCSDLRIEFVSNCRVNKIEIENWIPIENLKSNSQKNSNSKRKSQISKFLSNPCSPLHHLLHHWVAQQHGFSSCQVHQLRFSESIGTSWESPLRGWLRFVEVCLDILISAILIFADIYIYIYLIFIYLII